MALSLDFIKITSSTIKPTVESILFIACFIWDEFWVVVVRVCAVSWLIDVLHSSSSHVFGWLELSFEQIVKGYRFLFCFSLFHFWFDVQGVQNTVFFRSRIQCSPRFFKHTVFVSDVHQFFVALTIYSMYSRVFVKLRIRLAVNTVRLKVTVIWRRELHSHFSQVV